MLRRGTVSNGGGGQGPGGPLRAAKCCSCGMAELPKRVTLVRSAHSKGYHLWGFGKSGLAATTHFMGGSKVQKKTLGSGKIL